MQYLNFKILSIFFALLFTTSTLQAVEYYCWKNGNDIRECGNYVPPEYSQKGFWRLGENGILIKIAPAPTAEEIAAKKLQEEEKQRLIDQAAEDQVLLNDFSSKEDIIDTRNAKINGINRQIDVHQIQLDIDKNRLKDMKEKYELDKESNLSKSQLELRLSDIEEFKNRIKNKEIILSKKIAERTSIKEKYDLYFKRYSDIKSRRVQKNNPRQTENINEATSSELQ